MAKISVIVPIYNSNKYLNRCLDSIKNQTLEDIEIILVNDNSTDNSLDIMNQYKQVDSRFKIIDLHTNKGPGYARNIGVSEATGKYIGFVDSDDYISKDMYKELFFCAEYNNVEIAKCNSISLYHGIDYQKFKRSKPTKESEIMKPKQRPSYINEINVECWNKIYKSDFFKNFKFDEDIKYEDYVLGVNIIGSANRIYSLNKPMYFYNLRFDSMVHKEYKKLDSDFLDIFECNKRIKKYYLEHGLLEIFDHNLNSLFLIHSMYHCGNLIGTNINYKDKKDLINMLVRYIELEYGNLKDNKMYEYKKNNSVVFGPKMKILENIFLDNRYQNMYTKAELMNNAKQLILENSRRK